MKWLRLFNAYNLRFIRIRLKHAEAEIKRLQDENKKLLETLERQTERMAAMVAHPNSYAAYQADKNTTDGERKFRSYQYEERLSDLKGLNELIS